MIPQEIIEILTNDGVMICPTSTIPGLSCKASSKVGIAKICHIKNRPASKSFIILVSDLEQLRRIVPNPQDVEIELLKSEQPTTVIFSEVHGLPKSLLAEDGSIGIRLDKHPFSKAITKALDEPIISTSANLSGNPSPTSIHEVDPAILEAVDYVVNLDFDYPYSTQASSIKRVVNGQIEILR